jgi:uncharacterized membrane protein
MMESRAKLLGHAIHPMLIVLPLGLLSAGLILDLAYFLTGNELFAAVAFVDIAIGVIGGLLAAVFGLWDWLAIPSGTRARAVGLWHGVGNVVVVGLFALSWWPRLDVPGYLPTGLPFALAAAGLLLALVTAWLGGELVERLGVGVDPGAHLDAPSSLSGEPAGSLDSPPYIGERPSRAA